MCRLEELSESLNGLRQRAKVAEDERDRLEGPKEVTCGSGSAAVLTLCHATHLCNNRI